MKINNSALLFIRVFLLSVATLLVLNCQKLIAHGKTNQPNILIIFTDDQGYGDLGCYGSKTNKTPRMDQLAKEGMKFTNFYAQHVCGPSRSALLTGRYPIRSKGWGMPADEVTVAELIKEVGYQTACIGKWDVSNRKPIIDRMPNAQGFDYYFGTLGANDGGRVTFHENNEPAGETKDMGSLIGLYTDKAIDYLKYKRDPKKPFVLYVAHTMMHTIIDASPEFKGNSTGGLYGDVVEEFDFNTGRLLDTVDKLGLRNKTLVIYTTDNGPWNQPAYTNKKKGHPEGSIFWGNAGPLRNGKGSCYEGGSRAPCIVRWPGKVPENQVSNAIFATVDFMPTFAKVAGFRIPLDRTIDGVDQTDLIFGISENGARDTYFYQGNGVRQGKWKYLAAKHQIPGYARDRNRKEVEELYDLDSDIGETTNLAGKHSEKVKELQLLLEEIENPAKPAAAPYPEYHADLATLRDTHKIGDRPDFQASSGKAVQAANRVFVKPRFNGMNKAEVLRCLGDPATISGYGISAGSEPDDPLVYRFDTGFSGLQFTLVFRNGVVVELKKETLE